MITIKVDIVRREIPTRWEDVTFAQYVELACYPKDWVSSVGLFLEMTPEDIRSSQFSEGMDIIVQALSFMTTHPQLDKFPTKLGKFKLKPEITTFPQLNAIMREQVIQLEGLKENNPRKITEPLARIAAIYCQGISEPFDEEKAEYLSKQFMDYPCTEILSVGEFYQTKAAAAASGGKITQEQIRAKNPYYKKEGYFKKLWHSLS